MARLEKTFLAELGAYDLESERNTRLIETARKTYGRRPRHVVWRREGDEPFDRAFLSTERIHECVCRRRIGLRGDDDRINILEDNV